MAKHLAALAALICVCGAVANAPARNVPIDDPLVFPESLDAASNGTLYIGSWKGIVYRALPRRSAKAWILPSAENGLLSILGVLVDAPRGQLWVCSVPAPTRSPPAAGVSTLLAFDLSTGAMQRSLPLPAPESLCNDISLAPDGTAYVSDTPNGRIFRISPGRNELELFAQVENLKGIDGIAFSGAGQLYVNLVNKGTLFRIDIGKDGHFAGLTPITPSRPLIGPDGLRLIKGDRFLLAENKAGTIDLMTVQGDTARIDTLRGGLLSPTSAIVCAGVVFGVERKVEYLRDPAYQGKDPGSFQVLRFPLPH